MRLVRRLTILLLIPIGLLFALDTFLTLRSDLNLLDSDLRRDEAILGADLAIALEEVWNGEGEAAAFALAARWAAESQNIEARIVFADAAPGDAALAADPRSAALAVREGQDVQLRARRDGELRSFTYVPLTRIGARPAALELSEALSHERALLAARIPFKLLTAAAMALLCGFVAWRVGVHVVGRPVAQLIEKARRIGAGDFSGPIALAGRSELSDLAVAMNEMAEMLEASARRLTAESAARISALEQLRHADRLTTVGKLASGLAHELGTPLNIVAGRAQMIASGESSERDEVQRAARVIGDQADRMTRIVRQLLDFARHRSGLRERADLAGLARETVAFLAPLARKRAVRLACNLEGAVEARVDAAQIQQVITNLVMNAIQASSAGGSVEVRVAERDVAAPPEPGHEPGRYALIEVEDHGQGIPADALPEIFDPFFTTKPVGEGTGLGLAVVYGILQEHEGWIEVESQPDRGSCFRGFVPIGGVDGRADPDRR